MLFALSFLSVAVAHPLYPAVALKNAHQSSLDAFSKEFQAAPYKNMILTSYAEPLLDKLDQIWKKYYMQNDASLFLREISDLVEYDTTQFMDNLSHRFPECKILDSLQNEVEESYMWNNLEKRKWKSDSQSIPSDASQAYNDDNFTMDNERPQNQNAPEYISDTNADKAHLQQEFQDQEPTVPAPFRNLPAKVAAEVESSPDPSQGMGPDAMNVAPAVKDLSIRESVAGVYESIKTLITTIGKKTGCFKILSGLGSVLIGSVLLGYIVSFFLFGGQFVRFLKSNTTKVA